MADRGLKPPEMDQEEISNGPNILVSPVDDPAGPAETVLQREISINNDSTTTANADLLEKRSKLLRLLQNNLPLEGDTWYLIPRDFLEDVMNLPVELFEELVTEAGVLDLTGIVDARGNLYPEDDEPVGTYNVLGEVFQLLSRWFGLIGDPVARALVINPQNHKIEVERFPTYLQVHTLGRNSSVHGIHLSTTKTFYDLFEMVRVKVLKAPLTTRMRIWFVADDSIDTYPLHLSTMQFLEISKKQLVLQNQFPRKLKDEGLNSAFFHLCAEVASGGLFPTDAFLKDESPGGNLGLTNLGNTCYMNLALQCLLHMPEINNYFYYNVFEKELNTSNPLGYNGEVAKAFGSLLHKLFLLPFQNHTGNSVLPRDFKYTVGHFLSLFQGYQQQDSQEFLSWLLDALHEDLNRIYDKPYCEKPELSDEEVNDVVAIRRLADVCWKQHKTRNDLVITDLFTGLYQLTLVCPTCNKSSITFDPFNDLTLPLPVNKKWYHTFTYIDGISIRKFEVELAKTANFDELINYLCDKLSVPRNELFLYEIFNNFFYKDFQVNYTKLRYFPIGEIILENDDVVIYRIQNSTDDIILPVIHSVLDPDKLYNVVHTFGFPLFVVLGPEDVKDYDRIKEKLMDTSRILSRNNEIDTSISENPMEEDSKGDPEENDKGEEGSKDQLHLVDLVSNTEISNSAQFIVKYHSETRVKSFQKVTIPHNRANLNNLPRLIDRIPLKKNEIEDEGFVLVDKQLTPVSSERDSETEQLSRENSEGECVDKALLLDEEMGGLGLLFDSVEMENPHETKLTNRQDISDSPTDDKDVVKPNMTLVCEWDNDTYKQKFTEMSWKTLESIPNPEASLSKSQLLKQKSSKVTLQDCLTAFSRPEILGDQDLWYCPRCKEHKQATKTIQLWSTGDYLTIHLKRFESARLFSDKIDLVVDFPVENLDMLPFVETSTNNIYDLVAVDNHYGGLGGGHYTAYAKNFRDGEWYYFNDSRVTHVVEKQECITAAAYLLFYRRRGQFGEDFVNINGSEHSGLQELLKEARLQFNERFDALRVLAKGIKDQVEVFKQKEEEFEDARKKLDLAQVSQIVEGVKGSKKGRSLIDPSDLGNEYINSALHRKQRLIRKDEVVKEDGNSISDEERAVLLLLPSSGLEEE